MLRNIIPLLLTVGAAPCDSPTFGGFTLRAYPAASSGAALLSGAPFRGVLLDSSAAVSTYGGAAAWTQAAVSSLITSGSFPAAPPDFLHQPSIPATFALSSAPLSLGAELWALDGGGAALARGVPSSGGGGWQLHVAGAAAALAGGGGDAAAAAAWRGWEAASVAGVGVGVVGGVSGAPPAPLSLTVEPGAVTWTLMGAPVGSARHAFALGIDTSGAVPSGGWDAVLPAAGRHELTVRAGGARALVPPNTLRAGYLYKISVAWSLGARWGFSADAAPWPGLPGVPAPASGCANVSGAARPAPVAGEGAGPAWVYVHVPPLGGGAALSPTAGTALLTPFFVDTAGWGAWLADELLVAPSLGAGAAGAALLAAFPLGPAAAAALSGGAGTPTPVAAADDDCAFFSGGAPAPAPAHAAAQAELARSLALPPAAVCAALGSAAAAIGGAAGAGGADAPLPRPPPTLRAFVRADASPGGAGAFWAGASPTAAGVVPVGQVLWGDVGDGRSIAALLAASPGEWPGVHVTGGAGGAGGAELPCHGATGCCACSARAPLGAALSLPPPAGANASTDARAVVAVVVVDGAGEGGVALVEATLRAPAAGSVADLSALALLFSECAAGAGGAAGAIACAGGAAGALAAGGARAAAVPFATNLAAVLLSAVGGALDALAAGAPPGVVGDPSAFRAAAEAAAVLGALPLPPEALAACTACPSARAAALAAFAAAMGALESAAAGAAEAAAAAAGAGAAPASASDTPPPAPVATAAAAVDALAGLLASAVLGAGGEGGAGAAGRAAPAGGAGWRAAEVAAFLEAAATAAALALPPPGAPPPPTPHAGAPADVALTLRPLLPPSLPPEATDRTPGRMLPYCGSGVGSVAARLGLLPRGARAPAANATWAFPAPLNPCVPASALAAVTLPGAHLRAQAGVGLTLPPRAAAALLNVSSLPEGAAAVDVVALQFGYSPVDERAGHAGARHAPLPAAGANVSGAAEGALVGVAVAGGGRLVAPGADAGAGVGPTNASAAAPPAAPLGTPPPAPTPTPLPNALFAAGALLPAPPAAALDAAPHRGIDTRPVYLSARAVSASGRPLGARPAPAAPEPFFITLPLRDLSAVAYRGAPAPAGPSWAFTAGAGDAPQWAFNLTCPPAGAVLPRNSSYPSRAFLLRGAPPPAGTPAPTLTHLNSTRLLFSSPLHRVYAPASGDGSMDALTPVVGDAALAAADTELTRDGGWAYVFSAPCGPPAGAVQFACAPGSGGAGVTYACPAAEAVPVCVAWAAAVGEDGGGAWAPAPNCSVVGVTATTVTCSCAVTALPLLLAARFAALPRAGANVFGAVTPVVVPRMVPLEVGFFILILALLGAGLLLAGVGTALDARGRRTFLARFLTTPEGATLNALCVVTQRDGGDMVVDRHAPPKRRTGKVHPAHPAVGAAGEGSGGARKELPVGGAAPAPAPAPAPAHRRRSGSDSDEEEDCESRPEVALRQASYELETFGLASIFTPPIVRGAPLPPFPPPPLRAVAAAAVRVIGGGAGEAPPPTEVSAVFAALPPRVRLTHPLAVALPWLLARAGAGFPPLAWLWRFSTRLPRATRVLMLLVATMLSLTVVAYAAALMAGRRSWNALPAPSLVASLLLGTIAAGVAEGAWVLLEGAAARWVEEEVFAARYPNLAGELRRRHAIDAALSPLPCAQLFTCLTVSKGGDVIKKGLAAVAEGGAFDVAPDVAAALRTENFWDERATKGSADAPAPPPAPPRSPAKRAAASRASRSPSKEPRGAKVSPRADGAAAAPARPPPLDGAAIVGQFLHLYELQALSAALSSVGVSPGESKAGGVELVTVSEVDGFTVEGLGSEAKAALARLALRARAVLRHECAGGLRELSGAPPVGGGCRHALFLTALLTLVAWCCCALTVFALWAGGAGVWGCVGAWSVGGALALCVLEPMRKALPLVNRLRRPPNPNNLAAVFAQLPAPLAPALEHAIATAEAAASLGALALDGGGGRGGVPNPGAYAAALPPVLLEHSFFLAQAARPLVTWARVRQRAVAQTYLHALLPGFGDAARCVALALAAHAWPKKTPHLPDGSRATSDDNSNSACSVRGSSNRNSLDSAPPEAQARVPSEPRAAAPAAAAAAAAAVAAPAPAPAPGAWLAATDSKGRTYFFNSLTRETKWSLEAAAPPFFKWSLEAAAPPAPAPAPAPAPPAPAPFAPAPSAHSDAVGRGWVAASDAKGRTYYYHSTTRVTQWFPPKGGFSGAEALL
jgi:hypothetical protein